MVGNVAYEIVVSKCGAKGKPPPPCPVGNSFEADTLVRTPNGDVPIAAIREGDLVLAYEDDGGDWLAAPLDAAFEALADGRVVVDCRVYEARQGAEGVELRATGEAVRRVEERSFRRVDELFDARFRLPSGEVVTISGTAEHPFYVPSHGGYIDLEALEEGVEVGLAGGAVGVLLGVERRFGAAWVYNFEVEGLHNYLVDGGVVVHNGSWKERVKDFPVTDRCKPCRDLLPPGIPNRGKLLLGSVRSRTLPCETPLLPRTKVTTMHDGRSRS